MYVYVYVYVNVYVCVCVCVCFCVRGLVVFKLLIEPTLGTARYTASYMYVRGKANAGVGVTCLRSPRVQEGEGGEGQPIGTSLTPIPQYTVFEYRGKMLNLACPALHYTQSLW